ncbi:N-acetyltransferase [Micromonospora sp. CA-263727]|uniref:N-acetyltransferase n=1 Tax=Micromonospora sp. CA-263727 TaxID=3239967 RepID=UPI003D8A39E8
MRLMNFRVRRATEEDVVGLSDVVAEALATERLGAWLVSDAAERLDVLRRYSRFVLTRGLEYGQVDTIDDHAAVTVWFARREPLPPSAEWAHDLHRLLGAHAARFALLHSYVDAVVPYIPHHHLAQVAARAGQSVAARALLASYHRALDADGLPAYAEISSDQPQDGLLGRLGYQPRSPILLDPGGPMIWRMWRPRPGGGQFGGLPRRVRLYRTATPFQGQLIPAAAMRFP